MDPNAVLYSFLSADSGLAAAVGTDIYGPPGLPPNLGAKKAISFLVRAGTPDRNLPVREVSFQVKCFGATPVEARATHEAVREALHGVQMRAIGSNTILSAWEEQEGQDLVDDDFVTDGRAGARRAYVLTFFGVRMK